MATQTETYKLNKPARTDKIDISALNQNMDIIEDELKKRPLNSDVAGAAFYDLDITAWTSVNFANEEGAVFYLSEQVDGSLLLAQIQTGRVPRIRFNSVESKPHTIILSTVHQSTVESGVQTTCSGTAANTDNDVVYNYSLIVVDDEGYYTISFSTKPSLAGNGTVKSVNGVLPDDDGNVVIPIPVIEEEPSTTKLDFSNWSNGSFSEHFDDGSAQVHNVLRDGSGAITSIGGITIVGVG